MNADNKQMEISENTLKCNHLKGDDLDKALHDCMTMIWKAYRSGNVKEYNSCFQGLYDKYDDQAILSFISGMGMGLAPAVNRKVMQNDD